MDKGKKAKHGFTLVELMLAVSIVGILTAMAIPSYGGYLQRSKTSEIGSQLKLMFVGASAYYASEFQITDEGEVGSACAVVAVPHAAEDAALGNHKLDMSAVYLGPDAFPSFKALEFAPEEPLYYAYNIAESIGPTCDIEINTPEVYIFEAAGDINGDDVIEAHQVTIRSSAENTLQRSAIVERARN